MKCSDAREMINAYIDNGIDPQKDNLLEEHIKNCEECRNEAAFLLRYKKAVNSFEKLNAPPQFLQSVKNRIVRERGLFFTVQKYFISLYYSINSMRFTVEAAGLAGLAVVVVLLYRPYDLGQKSMDEAAVQTEREFRLSEDQDNQKEKTKEVITSAPVMEKTEEIGTGAVKKRRAMSAESDGEVKSRASLKSSRADDLISDDFINTEKEDKKSEINDAVKRQLSPTVNEKSKKLSERRLYPEKTGPEFILKKYGASIRSAEKTDLITVYTVMTDKESAGKILKELNKQYRLGEVTRSEKGGLVELVIPVINE